MRSIPFTTLRIEDGTVWFWEDHVARLRETAAALGYPVPSPGDLYAVLPRPVGGSLRVRISVDPKGEIHAEVEPYEPPAEPWNLRLVPIDPDPDVVRLKTTSRVWYDAARDLLEGEDDALLVLEGGQDVANPVLLETTIANLFFEIDGEIVTPAASAPFLPGIARAHLLKGASAAKEAVLTRADARRATACCVTNALFGAHPVETVTGWDAYDSRELARQLMDRLRSSRQESV